MNTNDRKETDNARLTGLGRLTALAHGDVRFAAELAGNAPQALESIAVPSPDPRPIVTVTEGHAPSGLVLVPWLSDARLEDEVREATEALLNLDPDTALEACVESSDPKSTSSTRFLVVGADPIADCAEDLISPPAENGTRYWSLCPGRTNLDRIAAIDGRIDELIPLPGAEIDNEVDLHIVRHGSRIVRCTGNAIEATLTRGQRRRDGGLTSIAARAARARLASRGVLVARPQTDVPALVQWALAGASPTVAEHTIRTASIHITATSQAVESVAASIAEIAKHYGITNMTAPAGAHTLCVVTNDLAEATLEAIGRGLYETKRRWMVVLWRNPYLVLMHGGPEGRPCLECARRTILEGAMAIAAQKTGSHEPLPIDNATTMHIGGALARTLAQMSPPGTLYARRLGYDGEEHTETIEARPDCPVCGVPGLRAAINAARTLRKEELDEEVRSEETRTGAAIKRLVDTTEQHRGHWTGRWLNLEARRFAADPRGRALHQFEATIGVLAGNEPATPANVPATGTGQSHRDACAAALREAVKARAAHFKRGEDRATEVMSQRQVEERGFDVITPGALGRFSATQRKERTCIGIVNARRVHAPKEYTDDERERERRWVLGRDLMSDQTVYVPAQSVFTSVPELDPTMVAGLRAGCAAGASRMDAATRALHENIASDALSMWWMTRRRCPKIVLERVDDPWIEGVRKAFAAHGRTLYALDISTTPKAPAMLSISALVKPRGDGSAERIIRAACGNTIMEALRAATSRSVQTLPETIEGDAFAGINREWEEVRTWRAIGNDAPPWLTGGEHEASPEDCADEGLQCDPVKMYATALEATIEAGAERTVGVDITEPGDPIVTVAVLTPGLRGHLMEKGAGRYDRLHRWSRAQDRTVTEKDLAPLGMVL